jgi:hypothetical protein
MGLLNKLTLQGSPYSIANGGPVATNILANADIPEGPFKMLLIKSTVLRAFQLTNTPNYAELAEKAEELYQEMINPPPKEPDPVEQAALQLEGQQRQANIEKTASETEKNYSEAENKKVDNAYKLATAGV